MRFLGITLTSSSESVARATQLSDTCDTLTTRGGGDNVCILVIHIHLPTTIKLRRFSENEPDLRPRVLKKIIFMTA